MAWKVAMAPAAVVYVAKLTDLHIQQRKKYSVTYYWKPDLMAIYRIVYLAAST